METIKNEQRWQRTNVTNLLRNRQSAKYYVYAKADGKQKWRTLKTEVFSIAKLRLADVEKTMRAQAAAAKGESTPGSSTETTVERFIAAFRVRVENNSKLAASSHARALDSVKSLIKTWPGLPRRAVRRLDKRRRGSTPKSLWQWMKRRAAVEPTIGHLKGEHRLERNRLKGTAGDAIFSAAAMNFQKLQGFFCHFWLRLLDLLTQNFFARLHTLAPETGVFRTDKLNPIVRI